MKNFRLFVVCGVLYVAHLIDAAYFGYFGNLFIYLFFCFAIVYIITVFRFLWEKWSDGK